MKARTYAVAVAILSSVFALAQDAPPHHHGEPAQQQQTQPAAKPQPEMQGMPDMDHSQMEHSQMDHSQMDHSTMSHMHHEESIEFSPGSGTAWAPQSSPENMWMTSWRGWQLMAHTNVIVGFNHQGGPRGVGKAQSQNWLMLMQHRKLGSGTIEFREMFSAEPLTTPHPGFPELFQTGETYHGQPLVDHQHPHDLFMELSARYVVPLTEKLQLSLYGAPAGEPALGPVAFMHRPSASETPDAPISHHVQDSAHISYGVITTGLIYDRLKIEGSAFNGREPDESRYNFDFGSLDSFSGRVQYAPTRDWALQYSYGHLRHPEALEPGNINRQTASVMYNRAIANGNWATSLIWGRNFKTDLNTVQNSYLLESTVNFAMKNYLFTRLELVDKDELFPFGGGPTGQDSFRIGEYTFGGVRDLVQNSAGNFGVGAQVTFYSKPSVLNPYYGNHPVSYELFIRYRAPKMKMKM
jgi:hypothetical protein